MFRSGIGFVRSFDCLEHEVGDLRTNPTDALGSDDDSDFVHLGKFVDVVVSRHFRGMRSGVEEYGGYASRVLSFDPLKERGVDVVWRDLDGQLAKVIFARLRT